MSTTAPTTQVGTGVKQKTADPTRTLVGAAFTDTGGAWADTDGKLWVLSYYNRRRKISKTTLTVQFVTATANYAEVDSGMRNNFISWSDEVVITNSKLQFTFNTTNSASNIWQQHNLDGTTPGDSQAVMGPINGLALQMCANLSNFTGATEAATHYVTIFTRSLGGITMTVSIGASSKENTSLYVNVNG